MLRNIFIIVSIAVKSAGLDGGRECAGERLETKKSKIFMGRTASLWFWRDWESDMALKACSLAAQGLWMRMLCIAAQHDPTGYVSVNRVGLDPEGIAKIAGAGVDEVRSLIGELSLNGVFSRDQHGAIYNRRMLRDEKKSATARKNGKLGGNPSLCKNVGIFPSDKGDDKELDKAMDNPKPIPKEKIKPSVLQKKEEVSNILERYLSAETAAKIVDHRKALKKPLTKGSAEGLAKAFVEWGDAEQAASEMMARGWQGFRPEWMTRRNVELANGHAVNHGRPAKKFVEEGTPEWNVLAELYRKTKHVGPPVMCHPETHRRGWYFQIDWPLNNP